MAQIAHASNGERPPQPHGTAQSACRAQTSLLLPPVEHERGSVCSAAEPWHHKLVLVVLGPARGSMSLPLASLTTHGMDHAWGGGCRWPHGEDARPHEAEIPRSSAWPHQLVVPRHELLIPFWKHGLADIPLALQYAALIRNAPQSCKWPCGLMDKALVFGTKDCRFESCQGHPAQPALRLKRWFCSSTEAALS